ncbi:MAG: citrate lyase subunit alpha [Methylocystaceae bacterium]|nr:citrate lyase subunit alpha [Methylocystaceae bacterium]
MTCHTYKWLQNLQESFDTCDINDGAVLSFHHHLRNGDIIMKKVLDIASQRNLKGLGIAISSIFPIHAPMEKYIQTELISKIWTGYIKGPVSVPLMSQTLPYPVTIQSHGGRARAIEARNLKIDVAFVAAPCADQQGNLTGALGPSACGPLGYPMVDAKYATHCVGLVDHISNTPLPMVEIPHTQLDYLIKVDSIGDPKGIVSGTTRASQHPDDLKIAQMVSEVVLASGLMKDGFSFQTGAGGISLASVSAIGQKMRAHDVKGSFISGGICQSHVDLVKAGLFDKIYDVQCFDHGAVASFARDRWHHAMSARQYASPLCSNNIVDQLDVTILGATQIDADFNVNVTTAGDGQIIGGPGGHPDTSEGAKLTIITTKLTGGGFAKIVDNVHTITTEGKHVDVLVCEEGIAVNPANSELLERLQTHGLKPLDIHQLINKAQKQAPHQNVPKGEGPVIATIENRHGDCVDVIRAT